MGPPGKPEADRDQALAALPQTYARALELRTAGRTPEQIAADLDIPPAAVPALLRLADAKLHTLLHDPSSRRDRPSPSESR